MKPLTRRSVTTGLAAAVTAVPAVGLAGSVLEPVAEGPSELAAKIRQLRAEYLRSCTGDDDADDRYYETVVQPLYRTFPCVPARSAEDALAALDYLVEEGLIESCGNGYEQVVESLVEAIRGYLAGRVA